MTALLPDTGGYVAPVVAIGDVLDTVGLRELLTLDAFSHVDRHAIETVVAEFGRLAALEVAPTDRVGDLEGSRRNAATGEVTTPAPIRHAYEHYVEGGWGSLTFPPEHGGGGFPAVVGTAIEEMLGSANLALSLNPMLTHGAIELLQRWGSDDQRHRFLPNLVSGVWTGTMNLTEPDAGSDLSGIRARAVPRGDGTWAVRGTKIFVTWGEHDLTENIVHMVLARTSDEPGTRGISLFVVPKFLLDPDGLPGERNRVSCLATEHKLGIHASPTCVMEYDEAVAELVGAEGEGLSAMFTMMNVARLSVGVQGLSVSERACQQADTFARERLQGRAPGAAPGERSAIIDHPDVRRMLLVIASSTAAQRLLLYTTAAERDLAGAVDAESDGVHQQRVELLTPIAKAWSTEEGVRNASLALQVHGGMGYVEETGIAQHLRDVRIAPIYEGTNGIQAIDLAVRKVSRDRGAAMGTLVAEMRETIDELGSDDELAALAGALAGAVTTLERATATLAGADEVDMLAAATSYLELAGLVIGGRLLAVHALRLRVEGSTGADRAVALARFFAVERLAEVASLAARVEAGGSHHVTL